VAWQEFVAYFGFVVKDVYRLYYSEVGMTCYMQLPLKGFTAVQEKTCFRRSELKKDTSRMSYDIGDGEHRHQVSLCDFFQ
jgi:hypothetical protein